MRQVHSPACSDRGGVNARVLRTLRYCLGRWRAVILAQGNALPEPGITHGLLRGRQTDAGLGAAAIEDEPRRYETMDEEMGTVTGDRMVDGAAGPQGQSDSEAIAYLS